MSEINKLTSENKMLLADMTALKEMLKEKTVELETANKKLKTTENKMIQSEKMISVGMLASGVAHELNNPLIAILGLADLILLENPSYESVIKDIKEIKTSALNCKKIINDWLGFVRYQEFCIQTADISEVIEKTMTIAGYRINSDKIEVKKEFEKNLPAVEMSISHIQQVFLNIVMNAADAMPQGGVLKISANESVWTEELSRKYTRSNSPDTKPIKIGCRVVVIKFKDSGKGISKEVLPMIFNPFFTTKDVGRGTGLGMYVSSGIVMKHKGTIVADSEGLGKGSIFTVILPISQMEL
ncbi:MAG: hypothetical protein LHV68_02490 [Elusimicrobia bacterium]|nr:hypothetical protein [Candidatus Liberimonas magnetica]